MMLCFFLVLLGVGDNIPWCIRLLAMGFCSLVGCCSVFFRGDWALVRDDVMAVGSPETVGNSNHGVWSMMMLWLAGVLKPWGIVIMS